MNKAELDNCPICRTELIFFQTYHGQNWYCNNDCFLYFKSLFTHNKEEHVTLFGREHFDIHHKHRKDCMDEINWRIDYWKENDRYLTELMTKE